MVLHRRYPKITFVSTNETNHLDKIHNTLKATIMKKIAPIAIAVLVVAGMTSCKKDYTCTCKDSAGKQVATYTYPKVKKSDAQSACDTWNNALKVSGGSCGL